ncbi:MAG TPA: helicase, partial [Candidatus Marinimicrobia bacterium]|nr:helicase [Candidatus Neomarinimicrobiota bacterium]
YIYDQLISRGLTHIAAVSGESSRIWDLEGETKDLTAILERFAPYTKLFLEKEWPAFSPSEEALSKAEQFIEWQQWMTQQKNKRSLKNLENPINILITTDTLSEGQNLQDCDMVINYDIHWNPVRIIQRMGRIDRLGSPNSIVYGINFWPSNDINSYLNLQSRIEQRMAAMRLAGAEVQNDFSDTFQSIIKDEALDRRETEKMLRQMEITWKDIDINERQMSLDKLSLERFRADLLGKLRENEAFYKQLPKGIFSGFAGDSQSCPSEGIIALLGYPSKPPKALDYHYREYHVLYLNQNGKSLLMNQSEVLDTLALHKDAPRLVPLTIDKGDPIAIAPYQKSLEAWLIEQGNSEETLEDGTKIIRIGAEGKDLIARLKTGDSKAISRVREDLTADEKFQPQRFDLIAWDIVSLQE